MYINIIILYNIYNVLEDSLVLRTDNMDNFLDKIQKISKTIHR